MFSFWAFVGKILFAKILALCFHKTEVYLNISHLEKILKLLLKYFTKSSLEFFWKCVYWNICFIHVLNHIFQYWAYKSVIFQYIYFYTSPLLCVFCSCYNQDFLIHMSNFVKIHNPIQVNEDYFCRQILPKIGSPSNYLQKLCEGRTFPKCVSLELYTLIGIEILSFNIQQYLLYFWNCLLTFQTTHDECSLFWECAILNKFLIKMLCVGAHISMIWNVCRALIIV